MAYLLALIIPIAFLYSPRTEKTNAVYVAHPLVIKQERKTPAYYLFQQTQKALQPEQRVPATQRETAPVELVTSGVVTFKPQTQHLTELKLERTELLERTEEKLVQFAQSNTDSTLLNEITQEPQFTEQAQTPTNAAAIRGQFELVEGVGIVDHIVSLRRVFEGQSIELGQVDLKAGQYQILVGSFEGELVAEIKDRNGLIIGEDRQKLAGLKRSGSFFEGPLLRVGQPSAFVFNPRTVDDRKLPEQDLAATFFSGNYPLKKTTDNYPNVARHSSTVGFIADKNGTQASILTLRSAKDPSETLLFTKKWVEGLQTYLSEKLQIQYVTDGGLILGRVMVDGKPIAGAHIMVENQPGVEPYYLDQFLIPQTEQTVTGQNGFFVIPGISPGSYQISAFVNERLLGSQLYVTDAGVVSYQEILSTNRVQTVIVRSFDAFSGEEAYTDVLLPGFDDILNMQSGPARYKTRAISGLQEIINRPVQTNYVPYIYMQSANRDHLHLPQISSEFLDSLRRLREINARPETAIFIGFVPQATFDLHVTDENFDRNNIIYFDSAGVPSSTPTDGGGFVIFNLTLGLQEVILQDQQTDRTFSQVVFAKDSQIYVSHFTE